MPETRTHQPIGYYVAGSSIDKLEGMYGSHLEELPINDRNALRLILSGFVYVNDVPMWEGSSLAECAEVVIPAAFDLTSTEFFQILEILQNINREQAIGLIAALSS